MLSYSTIIMKLLLGGPTRCVKHCNSLVAAFQAMTTAMVTMSREGSLLYLLHC